MIKFINSWAQGIILAVIIATIIELILPEGNNKKYVKTIIGIYIMFVIIYPLISAITNKKVNVQTVIDNTVETMNKYNISNNLDLQTNVYIEDVYKKSLEEDITKKMNEKGYNVSSLSLYLELKDENNYGQIIGIVMQISRTEKKDNDNKTNNVNNIETVEINVSKNNNTVAKAELELPNEDINLLKDYLSNTYDVEKERIHINE